MNLKIAKEKAIELIDVKYQIKHLLSKEKRLKEEIKPLVKEHGRLSSELGYVYHGESKGAKSFSREVVLKYLKDSYGDSLADQVNQTVRRKESQDRPSMSQSPHITSNSKGLFYSAVDLSFVNSIYYFKNLCSS